MTKKKLAIVGDFMALGIVLYFLVQDWADLIVGKKFNKLVYENSLDFDEEKITDDTDDTVDGEVMT